MFLLVSTPQSDAKLLLMKVKFQIIQKLAMLVALTFYISKTSLKMLRLLETLV